jgi:glycerophosphoryl diester phosphodiesterase
MSASGKTIDAAWPYPTLFAHRGGGVLAPENTMAAMRTGKDHGFCAVEFDVKLSGDSVAMLMHDDTLERTSDGRGRVADLTMLELEKLDAGSWYSPAFRGEPIPRFSAVAHFLHGLGIMANVEIKPCAGRDAETGSKVATLCAELWGDRVVKPLVSSFSLPALEAARAAVPELLMGLLVEKPEEAHFPLLDKLACVSLHCNHQHVTADLVRRVHATGRRLMCYTVNDVARIEALVALGVDGIFTDQLESVARHFPEWLADGGRAARDPLDDKDADWRNVVPPMP